VEQATGPRRSDSRSRFSFRPNRSAERREIEERFREGLHYLGDWHTHPEPTPEPSPTDIESMQEMVLASRHELPGFIMMIVGTAPTPVGFSVSLHYGRGGWRRYSVVLDTPPEADL
jgi:integrative and conjugative element protein (TIGR02256 family)